MNKKILKSKKGRQYTTLCKKLGKDLTKKATLQNKYFLYDEYTVKRTTS